MILGSRQDSWMWSKAEIKVHPEQALAYLRILPDSDPQRHNMERWIVEILTEREAMRTDR